MGREDLYMYKLKNRLGMTMAELLMVVAIIAVLGGVGVVAVWNYQRSLGRLERDSIAKEIFIAAQNHLTVASGEGYLGVTSFGPTGTVGGDEDKDVHFFTVNGDISESTAIGQMLPFGSIDETVRMGGSYIVRYQKDTGRVLDVFYCTRSGSPDKFNHILTDGEYTTVMGLAGEENVKKAARQTYVSGGNSILGWYGGTDAAEISTLDSLKAPKLSVKNAEKLTVTVTDSNASNTKVSGKYSLQVVISGKSSNAKKSFILKTSDSTKESSLTGSRLDTSSPTNSYTIILDDITTSGVHFDDIVADSGAFIPGENIEIQAVAYSISAFANIAYSNKVTTNSLFESIEDIPVSGDRGDGVLETAYIGNIRHLENLDANVSSIGSKETISNSESSDLEKFKISAAQQTTNLNWTTDNNNFWNGKTITAPNVIGKSLEGGYSSSYYAISPDYLQTYDGKSHSISNITASGTNAGMFGSISSVKSISNIELIDFNVTGTSTAGALAGSILNSTCNVTNVLARNSLNASSINISAPTAGGLIGSINGGTLQYCAAAVIVGPKKVGDTTITPITAGGLVGTASGTINSCYSGGHTKAGSYEEWIGETGNSYDVTGGTAGGLIGSSTATISNSYSTCSVSGTTKAGGFAGSAGGSITNCYATGLVKTKNISADGDRETNKNMGAFAGSLTGSATNCKYYSMINKIEKAETKNEETIKTFDHYLGAVGDANNNTSISPLDLNAGTYNAFVGSFDTWNPARAYDSPLVKYYSGMYPLRTVGQLLTTSKGKVTDLYYVTTHYGDWPSPEVFFINTAA